MLTISADEVDRSLRALQVSSRRCAWPFATARCSRCAITTRSSGPDGAASTLLLMPAWTDFEKAGTSDGGYIGVKIVTVSPDNNQIGKPAVMGLYLLLDGKTGEPQALIDGQRLTQWRTACASALAASYLAREDASKAAGRRRRCVVSVPGAGSFGRAADRRDQDLEPHLRQCREGGRCIAARRG
jgi:ornithine cyclodeaminase